jgi:hypothetical protein
MSLMLRRRFPSSCRWPRWVGSRRTCQESAPNPLLAEFRVAADRPHEHGRAVDDVEAVESDPSTIYVAPRRAACGRPTTTAQRGCPVFDAQPNLSIGDIAIAPSNPNVVWVGTGEANQRQSTSYGGGVFKSVDAGKTWTFMGLRDSGTVGRILIDPKNPDVVYIAAGGDLFKPTRARALQDVRRRPHVDEIEVHRRRHRIHRAVMDPSNSQTLIAAVVSARRTAWGFNGGGPGSALWKTIDAGKTWNALMAADCPPTGAGDASAWRSRAALRTWSTR